MWQGSYKRWNPISFLEGKRLYIDAIHDDLEGFRIWFSSESKHLGVVTIAEFENVQLYVNSDKMYRLSEVQNSKDLDFPHTFWKVEDSALLQEFHRQSKQIYVEDEIKHYAFLSCSDCIDVLSWSKPIFSNLIESDEIKEL